MAEINDPKPSRCPNCGYCPSCGRADRSNVLPVPYPVYPWAPYNPYPYSQWYGTITVGELASGADDTPVVSKSDGVFALS